MYPPTKITHVISNLSEHNSGPAGAVIGCCRGLEAQGITSEIVTLLTPEQTLAFDHLQRFPATFPAFLGYSRFAMAHLCTTPTDLFHVHSLWQWTTLMTRKAAQLRGLPYVLSPHGTLMRWPMNHKRWKKQIALALWERASIHGADLLHVTSLEEAAQIRELGFGNPMAVIPNGLEFPEPPLPMRGPMRTALFLSRFHPVKGVDPLLRAWAQARLGHPEWVLRLVGPDEGGYKGKMKALARELGLGTSVEFLEPAYGEAKQELLGQAQVLVLPSLSENFGNVVAEALAAGLPVLATTGAPWSVLETEGCGWHVPLEDLTATLRLVLQTPEDRLRKMGQAGQSWARRVLAMEAFAARLGASYRWLFSNEPKPDWII